MSAASLPVAGFTYYLDTNGTTAGSGAASGTWDMTLFNKDITGGATGGFASVQTTSADIIFFSAGTNGTGGTVTLGSAQAAKSINFQDPAIDITLAGSPLTLGAGAALSVDGLFITSAATSGNLSVSAPIQFNNTQTGLTFSNAGSGLLTVGAVSGALSSGTTTLNVKSTSTGGIVLSGELGDGTNGGNLTLRVNSTGTGSTALTAANTYTGVTTVSAGTLSYAQAADGGAAGGLGQSSNAAANVLLANGTTLSYTGSGGTTDRLFTINGSGGGHSATLDASGSGAITYSNTGAIAFGSTDQTRTLILTGSNTGNNTLASFIGNNGVGASVNVTKNGLGTWVLTGENTFSGTTTLNAGILSVGSLALNSSVLSSNLGGGTGSVTALTFGGGTLQYTGANQTVSRSFTILAGTTGTFDVTQSGTTLTYAGGGTGGGAGVATTGGLTKTGAGTLAFTGTNFYTGTTTISAGTLELGSSSGKLSSSSSIVNNGVFSIRRSTAVVQGTDFSAAGISGTGGFTQVGAGTTTLNVANTYTGATTVSAGTLNLAHQDAVQASTLTLSGGSVVFDSTVSGNAFTTGGLAGSGNLALQNNAGSPAAVALTVGNGNNTASYSGTLSGAGSLIKTGSGTQTLTGTNTYTGGTTLNAGTVNFTTGGLGTSGAVTFTGNATLQYGSATTTDLSSRLAISNGVTATVDTNGNNVTFATGFGASGSGALTKVGSGTLTLSGSNTYTGATTINAGTLSTGVVAGLGAGTGTTTIASGASLNLTGGALSYTGLTTIAGAGTINVTLGTGSGTTSLTGDLSGFTGTLNIGVGAAAGAGKVLVTSIDNAGATFNVLSNGTLFVNSSQTRNATVYLNGGDTGESLGQLRLGQNAIWAGNVILAGDITGTGDGSIGANTSGGTISGVISETGGPRPLVKVGAGTIVLSGSNTYTGATTVAAGVLTLQSATGLGSTAAGTSVSSGAALQVQNNITVGAEALALSGTGVAGDGALRNISGTNTYGGLLSLGSTSRINSDAGTLVLSNPGTITGATFGLSVGGAGNTSIDGIIGTTTGGLTKDGTGALTLNGANTYTGLTTVSAGSLLIGSGGSLASGNALTLGASGTADFANVGQTLGAVSNDNTATHALNFSASSGTVTLASLAGAGNTRFGSDGSVTGGIASGTVTSIGNFNANISGGATTVGGLLTGDVSGGTVGAGSLSATTVSGGTTTITGAAGITTLSSGTTTVGGVATIGTLSGGTANLNGITSAITTLSGGTVNLGASTTLSVSGGTSAGVIAGTGGSLTKTGGGTLTLTGANTYTGTTTVSAGTLTLHAASGAALASTSAVGVASGATVSLGADSQINSAATLTLAGGTLDLNGFNQTLGTLDLNAASALNLSGSSALVFADSSALDWNSATLSISNFSVTTNSLRFGTTSGGLTATQLGLFRFVEFGNVAALIDANGFIAPISSNFLNTGSSAFVISTAITGATTVDQTGSGTTTLTGVNTSSGAATVTAGTLVIGTAEGGNWVGNVTVGGSGILKGRGTITGAVAVDSGGTYSPGNSPAIQNVGSLTISTGGFMTIELDGATAGTGAGFHDQVISAGAVTLNGGTLSGSTVFTGSSNYLPTLGAVHAVITGSAVTGTFAAYNFASNPAGISFLPEYTTTAVNLYAVPADYSTDVAGLTANQTQVGAALQSLRLARPKFELDQRTALDARGVLFSSLKTKDAAGLRTAYDQLTPEKLTALAASTFQSASLLNASLQQRSAELRRFGPASVSLNGVARPAAATDYRVETVIEDGVQYQVATAQAQKRVGYFAGATGAFAAVDASPERLGSFAQTGAGQCGLDYTLNENQAVGLVVSQSFTDTDFSAHSGSARTITNRVGVFYDYHHDGFFLNAAGAAGFSGYDTQRKIGFLNQVASGETQGWR